MKCPHCGRKNLYLKRTFPMEKYGCKDCEKLVKHLKECGLSKNQIRKTIKMGER